MKLCGELGHENKDGRPCGKPQGLGVEGTDAGPCRYHDGRDRRTREAIKKAVLKSLARPELTLREVAQKVGRALEKSVADSILSSDPGALKTDDGREMSEAEARRKLETEVLLKAELHALFEVREPDAIRIVRMDPVPGDEELREYLSEPS